MLFATSFDVCDRQEMVWPHCALVNDVYMWFVSPAGSWQHSLCPHTEGESVLKQCPNTLLWNLVCIFPCIVPIYDKSCSALAVCSNCVMCSLVLMVPAACALFPQLRSVIHINWLCTCVILLCNTIICVVLWKHHSWNHIYEKISVKQHLTHTVYSLIKAYNH